MKSIKFIEKVFLEATKGIVEEWLIFDHTFWYNYVVNLDFQVNLL